jgi:hypothetical protein
MCPTIDEWIKKTPHTMEFYSSIEKNKIVLFAGRWMELENIMLSEGHVFPHMWKKIHKLNVHVSKYI